LEQESIGDYVRKQSIAEPNIGNKVLKKASRAFINQKI